MTELLRHSRLFLATLVLTIFSTGPTDCLQEEEHNARLARVQLFDQETHLPAAVCVAGACVESSPAMGRVPSLDIKTPAQPSSAMSTIFHVYTHDRSTRGLRFQVPELPELILGANDQQQEENMNQLDPELEFQFNLTRLAESGFEARGRRTVIMIAGFLTNEEEEFEREARDLWLELLEGRVNVITVGWPDSNGPLYEQAAANTMSIARQITILLHYLAQLSARNLQDQEFLDSVHLVGHSLGAHICGFVGKQLGGRVGRITGLDPAGPLFDSFPAEQRLDRSDAQLVEVLHTNAGHMHYTNAFPGVLMNTLPSMLANTVTSKGHDDNAGPWFGIDKQLGHLDYYANNGRLQEGCTDPLHICDHGRAHEIYVDILKYQTRLSKLSRSGEETQAPKASVTPRIWAFRARDYETFERGSQFSELCPQMMSIPAHLRPQQVAQSFNQCAVPLLDFLTPTNELIRELKQVFGVSFDSELDSRQQRQRQQQQQWPRYFFRTQTGATTQTDDDEVHNAHVGDHYLLKIYLDRQGTQWDPARCSLEAKLEMAAGETMRLQVDRLEGDQDILALPFAHPAGSKAHSDLLRLLPMIEECHMSAERVASCSTEKKQLFKEIFPRTVNLKFLFELPQLSLASLVQLPTGPSSCQLSIKEVEVHPVAAAASITWGVQNNVGALYGSQELTPGPRFDVLSASQFVDRLVKEPPLDKLTPGFLYELKLESALVVDRPQQ